MKTCTTKLIMAALLIGFTGVALANQATIVNASKSENKIEVSYQVFHQNPGQSRVLGRVASVTIGGSQSVGDLSLDGYKWVGIMPVAVQKISLPVYASNRCALLTSDKRSAGTLILDFSALGKKHGTLSCTARGDTTA